MSRPTRFTPPTAFAFASLKDAACENAGSRAKSECETRAKPARILRNSALAREQKSEGKLSHTLRKRLHRAKGRD